MDREPPPSRPPRRSSPPFRGRGGALAPPATILRGLDGLTAGGSTDDLAGVDRARRLRGALVSAGFHLLLLAALVGGALQSPPTVAAPVESEERPLLAFEAPPLEPLVAEALPEVAVAEEPPTPDPSPDPGLASPAPIAIPEALIAAPSTGFQNDLPFSDGDDEEFAFDQPMGADDGLGDTPAPTAPEPAFETVPDIPPIVTAEAPPEPLPEATPETPDPSPPDLLADASGASLDPADPDQLNFDLNAFRERIADPAGDARRRADERAREAARVRAAEADSNPLGAPTDIWRFLEGKRFRNPEGGLTTDRNNTLYYDDRGANLVPWIGRLIAEVRRNWYVPYAAAYQAGHVAIAISVLRDGTLEWMHVVVPSGTAGFDNAAVGALRAAELLPLPGDYPGRNFEIMLVFWYNEQPHDIFSGDQPEPG